MIALNLGSTTNNLTPDDYHNLANQTEGFSGSDIGILVKAALMEPIKKCQTARFFRQIQVGDKVMYTPSPPSDPGAQEMTIMQVPPNSLKAPDVTGEDFFNILSNTRPTVSQEDLIKQEDFTREFGMDG